MNSISIKKIALSLLLALLLLTSLSAQGFDNQLSSTLQNQLDQFRNKYHFTGMSVAIVSDDYGIWTGTSGFSQESINSSISSEMIFSIGSVTKTYVATLIMQLEDEGILSIDDSLFQ